MRFDQFVEAIKQHMQPEGRAQHMATMVQQLLAATPADVTLADLAAGWRVLARPQAQQEQASVRHRREICAELSAMAARLTCEPGMLAAALRTWQAWQDACQRSAAPGQAAMAKMFARELIELQSATQ
ncbi:MAG TPA: hypothetical protein VFU22_12245 [Roseiflexaceae bacterium]|nr:hypothetical protein [Roseiflexaceae bacterium]